MRESVKKPAKPGQPAEMDRGRTGNNRQITGQLTGNGGNTAGVPPKDDARIVLVGVSLLDHPAKVPRTPGLPLWPCRSCMPCPPLAEKDALTHAHLRPRHARREA
jgi:hypothetical protein